LRDYNIPTHNDNYGSEAAQFAQLRGSKLIKRIKQIIF